MTGGVGYIWASHVCEPQKATNDGKVDGAARRHVIMGGGVWSWAIISGESEALLHRRVIGTGMAGSNVRGKLGDEVGNVELLREVDGTSLTVTSDGDA